MAKDEPKQLKVPRVDTQQVVDWGKSVGIKRLPSEKDNVLTKRRDRYLSRISQTLGCCARPQD